MLSEDEEIARSVARYGWQAICVNDTHPAFVYTCGLLTTFGHPELIIFGLEQDAAHSILAVMVDDLRHGKSYAAPGIYDGVLEGWPIAVREVHPTWHEMYLGYAMGHCRLTGNVGGLRALQVFWPDKAKRFPFEAGCDLEVWRSEPRLDVAASADELRAIRRRYGG